VGRRNKILKAEVAILKSGMQDLMQLVDQHTKCLDTRLRLYLQREADRLAARGQRNDLPSPSSSSRSP
jgi:cyclic AMP-dependent transcription factor ATF-2